MLAEQEMWVLSLGQDDPLEEQMAPTPLFIVIIKQTKKSRRNTEIWCQLKTEKKKNSGFNKPIQKQI